ncbi:MAG TPA: hypothetical protein PKY87_15855 [Terricaulis sp.]|nr:hypothetical protein [Terricaulis sp.]
MIIPGLALARVEDIPDAGARLADADGVSLILTRRGDVVRAAPMRMFRCSAPMGV